MAIRRRSYPPPGGAAPKAGGWGLAAVLALAAGGCGGRLADFALVRLVRPEPEAEVSALVALLPGPDQPHLGLIARNAPAEYLGQRLQAYLGDRAVIFLEYGFRSLATIRYADAVDPRNTVIIEVYEMGSPLDAVAVLRLVNRLETPTDLGFEGREDPNTIAYAQDRYYVVARTVVMRRERWQGLRDLVGDIGRRIGDDRTGLDLLDQLPADAVRGTVYFVRTQERLGDLVALPEGGAFAFHTADTVALTAERADGDGALVLIQYPEASTAAAAAELARSIVGRVWSRWAVTQRGRYVLTFVRHAGNAARHDVEHCEAVLKRIAPEG